MTAKKKSPVKAPILSAGGIVTRGRKRPLIAIVQLRQQKTWVLPKGKLHKNETTIQAARREAIEETGRDVLVYEYLGQIVYQSRGRPKVAKFWRMEARGKPLKLMRDVQKVEWLPLAKAVAKLTRERERKFLRRVGPRAISPPRPQAAQEASFARVVGWFRRGLDRLR